MKELQNSSQLEMFSDKGIPCGQNNGSRNIFFGSLRGHEKIIILLICFIITGVISFSLGVERGKKIAALNVKAMQIEIANTTPQPDSVPEPKRIFKNNEEEEKTSRLAKLPQTLPEQTNNANVDVNETVPATEKKSCYTIQLASYKTSTLAKKEAQKLEEKGHTPLVINKGKYIILCVGNFTDKESAKTKLSELKKKYRDGIIRRL